MNAINNITISKKLIAAFLILVVIIGALAGMTTVNTNTAQKQVDDTALCWNWKRSAPLSRLNRLRSAAF